MKRILLIAAASLLPLVLAQANNPIQFAEIDGSNLSVTSSTNNQVVVTGNITQIVLEP